MWIPFAFNVTLFEWTGISAWESSATKQVNVRRESATANASMTRDVTEANA